MGLFSLTPISKEIQQRLFDKIKLLSREGSAPGKIVSKGGLTHNDIAVRTTFIRMASGLEKPVVLMGGELKDGKVLGGYDDIYGSRGENKNTFNRPPPGIKSMEAAFKGGTRALRQATVSWTCWSLEDIDRLTPHFFQLGGRVLLEWGWVYNKKSFEHLPTFINKQGIINKSFGDYYSRTVNSTGGDIDAIEGLISKFEYTVRADGGFDCTTTILTTGTNVIDTPVPNKKSGNSTVRLDIDKIEEQLEESRDKDFAILKNMSTNRKIPVILDGDTTLKSVIRHIDEYLADKMSETSVDTNSTPLKRKSIRQGLSESYKSSESETGEGLKLEKTYFNYIENQYIIEYTKDNLRDLSAKRINSVKNAWVKWGWFEDNILSKFLTIIGTDENIPAHEFRSIRKLSDSSGNDTNLYESNRIRNHKSLETVAPNRYILPGQFNPIDKLGRVEGQRVEIGGMSNFFKGDSETIKRLAKIANQSFNAFTTDTDETFTTIETTNYVTAPKKKGWEKFKNFFSGKENEEIKTFKEISTGFGSVPGNHGFLRNMLINTDIIQEAFGVREGDVETLSVKEALINLFSLLNQPLDFWKFDIQPDGQAAHRVGIIDKSLSEKLPEPGESTEKSQVQKPTTISTVNSENQVKNNGVFFFPTWRSNTIVKSQNITVSPPTAQQLSLMYGANAKKVRTLGDNPENMGDERAKALAGLTKDPDNPDKIYDDLDIALFKKGYGSYGAVANKDNKKTKENEGGLAPKLLSKTAGDDNLKNWINQNLGLVNATTQEEIDKLYAEEEAISTISNDKNTTEILTKILPDPDTIPAPLPTDMTNEQYLELYRLWAYTSNNNPNFSQQQRAEIKLILGLYNSKFNNKTRKMKQKFIDSVAHKVRVGKKFAKQKTVTESDGDRDQSVLLPFRLELDIDGIGGIHPGNSCHSTYMQQRYKDRATFQIIDVGHQVDGTGWTTTLTAIMRTSPARLVTLTTKKITTIEEIVKIDNQYKKFMDQQLKKEEAPEKG